ncbi:MAG TPA: phosphate ABC transporter permease PstA [Anaerolineae bacterium]|nr:phosphate ABC transporter permease PstA [Anaerolineae bacterium]
MSAVTQSVPSTAVPTILPRGLIKSKTGHQRRRVVNIIMLTLTGLLTLVAMLPLIWVTVYTAITGARYINLNLFTQLPVAIGEGGGGVTNAVQGTIIVILLGMLISIPLGILAAFYVAEKPNTRLGFVVRFSTDVLAGVPSIIIGLFGYAILVKPLGTYSAFAGGVAISIIMLPTIIRTTEEMLKLVPKSLREGSLALGAPDWHTSLIILLPAALEGVITGIMLAIARGVGETAPLLFTILGNDQYSVPQIVQSGVQNNFSPVQILQGILVTPTDALTLTMYKYSQEPFPEHVQQAWAVALVVMFFVLGINIITRTLTARRAAAR